MATKIEWTDKTWNPITGCTKKVCWLRTLLCGSNGKPHQEYGARKVQEWI